MKSRKIIFSLYFRLHITPTPSPNSSLNVSSGSHHVSFADSAGGSSPRRGVKRKRLNLNEDYISFEHTAPRSYKVTN